MVISLILTFFKKWNKQLLMSISLLMIGVLSGIINASIHPTKFEKIIFNKTIYSIFCNNIKTCSLIIILGILSLGIISSLIIIYNSYIIGYILTNVYKNFGIKPIFNGLFPHFLWEISAILIASTLSFGTIKYLVDYLRKTKKLNNFFSRSNLLTYVTMYLVMFILIVVGSIIECKISKPLFIN